MTLFELPVQAVPAGPVVRVRMTVAYDGTELHGFAAQPGLRTVAGMLSDAIERVLGYRVTLTGAGRTDRGVHAWGQVVTFDAPASPEADLAALQRAVNKLCGPAIVARDVRLAPADFDARFSARSRTYRYQVLNRPVPDPFLGRTTWWVPQPLDLAALRLASDPLIGEHDFSSFCRRPKGPATEEVSLVRRVIDTSWSRHGEADDILRLEITASSFCHQMVRSLVGTLVAMGRGDRRPGEMLAILNARDRRFTPNIAPPHGLCLWEVGY